MAYFVNLKDPERDYNAECEYKWIYIETEQNGNGYTTTLDSWEMNSHQFWCGILFIAFNRVQLGWIDVELSWVSKLMGLLSAKSLVRTLWILKLLKFDLNPH